MDNTLSIEEGNKLIAEFMGEKICIADNGDPVIKNKSGQWRHVGQYIKYHSSWDWLMPVVKKCFDYSWKISGSTDANKDYKNRYKRVNIKDALRNVEIEAVWQAVVEFIQFYNSQSK